MENLNQVKDTNVDADIVDTDASKDSPELLELLNVKKNLTQTIEKENLENKDELQVYLAIFLKWIKYYVSTNVKKEEIYNKFSLEFDCVYRMKLFEIFCNYFNDESIVTDDVLFYWKYFVFCITSVNKKYNADIKDVIFSFTEKTTNFRLVKVKHIFRIFIDDDPLCYFKENGNDYYVS